MFAEMSALLGISASYLLADGDARSGQGGQLDRDVDGVQSGGYVNAVDGSHDIGRAIRGAGIVVIGHVHHGLLDHSTLGDDQVVLDDAVHLGLDQSQHGGVVNVPQVFGKNRTP